MVRAKKYYFYVADKKLQSILDELKQQGLFAEVMQSLLKNNIEKQIIRKLKDFKKLEELSNKGSKKK